MARAPASLGAVVLNRVIPCLDVDKGRVVKGVEFVDLRDAGDPVELAVRYQDEGADEIVATWGVRICVAIDVRGGNVSVSGWTQTTQMPARDVIERLQGRGVKQFVYTNVDRDGMLEGPDLDDVRTVGECIRGRFIYSGGIASLDDLRALKELRLVNLAGVISGKALYEGRFTIADARELLHERSANVA